MTLRTLNYGNYGISLILGISLIMGIFLIMGMGNAGFCPSAVSHAIQPQSSGFRSWGPRSPIPEKQLKGTLPKSRFW